MKKSSTRPAWSLALALEPRMMFDAAAVTTAADVAEATAVAATAPAATATPVADGVFIIDANGTPGSDVRLFNDASVSADSSGEEISKLVVTVSTTGSNQALVVDGTAISLTATSAFGETDKNHYSYRVEVSDTTTTLTLFLNNAATVTPAAVETLIEGIGYRALDGEVSNGEVTVTLKSLTDAGNDVALLDISATLTVENDKNLAPHIDGTHDLSLLDDLTATELNDNAAAVSYSLDGNFAYVASSTGTLVVYSVADSGVMTKIQTFSDTDSLNTVNGMAVGKDAVYVLSGSTIVVLNRAADGMLSVGSTLAVGDESRNVAISEDGAQLYVSARWNGIYVYDIGADGVLSFSSRYTENADRSAGLTSVGDYVFVMAPGGSFQTLTVLKRAVVGGVTSLSLVDTTTIDSSFDFTSAWQLAASGDGGRIFTLNTSTGDLIVWRFDGSILTKIETRSVASATDLAVSRDGSLLYVSNGEGQLSVYAVGTSGTLTLLSSQSTGGSAALAAFGTSLAAVGGSSVEVYTSIITYTVGSSPVPVTRGMTVSDSNADVLNDGAGNYNGATITLTASGSNDSQFSFASDSGLIRQGNQLLLDGAVIASVESTANAFKVTFTADITTATANKVLQQIMWATRGTSSALVTLNVVVNDGQLNSNTGSVLLRVNTSPLIDPDVAADFTLPQGTSETDYWLELPDLFRDEDGDNLLWTVSGLPDGLTFNAETQTISGSTTETGMFTLILSVRDSSGAAASLSRDLVIIKIDNRSPEVNWDASTALSPAVVDTPFSLTLDRTLFSDADAIYGDTLVWSVEGLPDGLTFDPATLTVSGTATSLTEATLTVTVTDKSGDTASREMTLRVITAEENANTQPTLTPMASSLIYTSEGGLSGYSYYVDAITLSDDGTRLVVIGTTGTNWGGTLYVSVYSRDTTSGELTLQKTYTQGTADDSSTAAIEMEGLKGTTQALFSPDGQTLYLSGTNSSNQAVLQAFTLGADASLTAVSGIGLNAAAVKLALSDDGSSVYAVTASGLFRFAVDAQGALSAKESFTDLGSVLTMDADQNGVFYVVASTGTIAVYTTDDSGMLSFAGKLTRSGTELTWTSKDGNASSAGTLSSGSGLNGTFMQMSAGGEGYVYVVTGINGYLTVLHFDADSGSMALVSSRSVYSELGGVNPMSVVVSQDGTALYVGSNGTSLVMYTIGDGGTLTYTRKITGDGALIAMAVSADGKSVYGGSRFYKNGLRLFDSAVDATEIAWTERDSSQIAGQLVLGDADYDASNNGTGDYNGAVITVQREWGASADDSYSFVVGNGLALENGNITLDGRAIATFTISEGMLTVTFTGEVSTAVANRVLHQISWQSTSKAPGSTLTMLVSISDPWTTASQSVLVNVTEVNDAPEVTAVGNDPTYRDTAGTVLVFGNAAVDTVESGQQIVQITLTVSGLVSGENDYLTIDGARVLLQDGVRVLTNNNIVIAVSVKEGVASLTIISDAGIEAEQAQSLLNSIGYGNPEAYTGSREIVLTGIKDNGGTERGGSDTALLDIRSTVTLQAQDAGPKLTSPDTDKLTWSGSLSEIDGLGTLTKSALSADGTQLYATDGSGTLALFSRDTVTGALTWVRNLSTGLANIDRITLLDNGSRLAISTLSDSASSSYTISIFSVAEDGSMTPLDSTSLWSVTSVLASDDGRLLYVFDMNGISVISIDADTGAMTTLQDIYADAWSEPHLWQVVNSAVTGDYLYVLTDPVSAQFPNAVIVYQRQADGTLALFGAVYDGRTDASGTALTLGSPSAVTASDDGSLIYVQTRDGLQIFSLNQKSGQIVRVAVMSDITGVNALAQGGGNLYVSLSDGSLQVYSVGTSGQLTLSSTWRSSDYAALAGATALMPTRDGGVVVGGSQLASLVTVVEDVRYTLGNTAALNFSDDVTLTHKALDVLNDGIGNYGGVDVIVSDSSGLGSFGFTAGSGLVMNSDGQVLDGGTLIASYVRSSAGLTLTFTDGVTTATANRVIASLTWFNADNATGRNVTLSIAVSDGELTSEVWQQNIVINHVPQVTDIVYVPAVITLGKGYTAMLPSELFSDADGDTLSWSIEGLPEGIAFDAATRTLTGTATTAGRYTLTVTVTDGDGASAVRQLTLRVNTPPELGAGETHFSVLSGSAIDLTLDDTLFSDADGDALQWRVDNLPAGLTFDADTRTLSGTLPSGNYSMTLTATDAWGASISRTLVLLSNRAPLVIDSAFTLPDATAQRGWQQVLPAGLFEDPDGDALVWQVDGLPDGMHFEPETRTLAGEPIALGRFVLTVTVTDTWGGVTSRTLTLVVLAAQPEQPEQPEAPQQPEQPEAPQRPEQPQQPGEPHQPEQPEQPQHPDEPGKPTRTPVDPDILETTAWSPFIGERDRQQFLWQAPEKQPEISADRPRDPLVLSEMPVLATGPLDYTASPWQLDPLMAQRLPTLEPVKDVTAGATDPALARTVAWQGEWVDAGNGTKTYTLPPGLAGRGGIISVRLANGRPLPEWVRFDAAHSRLYLSGADAERVGQIQLRLQRANGEPALLLTLSGSDVQAGTHARERSPLPTSGGRITAPDGAFNTGVSHALDALRGDGDDLLLALNALARD